MDLYDAIRARKSVRSYAARPVPRAVLKRILEAAREAPSANNLMPWKLVVVSDQKIRAAIAASGIYGGFISQAPILLVACGDARSSPSWYEVDTSIALEHIVLAATAEGLGSCWVGSFDEETVKKLVGIPEDYRVVALLPLGYPEKLSDAAQFTGRRIPPSRALSKIASEGSFDLPWKE